MVFDLIWITNLMTGGGKNAANIAQVSKASRAARLGSRTIRLIRLFRLIRIIKMYKAASKTLAKKTERLFSERHVTTVVKHSWHLQNRIESLRNM